MNGETFPWAALAYVLAGVLTARMIKGVSPSPWRAWVWALAVLGWPVWWAALVWGLLTPGVRGRR
jgi:hypothetical protein